MKFDVGNRTVLKFRKIKNNVQNGGLFKTVHR